MGKDREGKIRKMEGKGGKGAKRRKEKGSKRKEKGKGRWERVGKRREGKKKEWGRGGCEAPEKCKNRDFYQIFIFAGPGTHPPSPSGTNLARKYRPMANSSMPNFIVIGVYYNI